MEFRSEIPEKAVFGPAVQTGPSALPRNGLSPVCADRARFLEGPFGETLRSTGLRAAKCNWKFATKYTDLESGWSYYGRRYYGPSFGRWASSDPEGERGGLQLYLLVENNPENAIDPIGLSKTTVTAKRVCSVDLLMQHGTPPPGPIHLRPPQGNVDPCYRWGFFGCHADRYNSLVPEKNRIRGIPSVPAGQLWPPLDRRSVDKEYDGFNDEVCKNVDDLMSVGRGLRDTIKGLCDTKCCLNDEVRVEVQIDEDMQENIDLATALIQSHWCRGNVNDLPRPTAGKEVVKCATFRK